MRPDSKKGTDAFSWELHPPHLPGALPVHGRRKVFHEVANGLLDLCGKRRERMRRDGRAPAVLN